MLYLTINTKTEINKGAAHKCVISVIQSSSCRSYPIKFINVFSSFFLDLTIHCKILSTNLYPAYSKVGCVVFQHCA